MAKNSLHFSTKVIHGEQFNDPETGAVMPSIVTSSTYAQKSPGEHTGFEYSRSQNPTRFAYERLLNAIEAGDRAFAFSSGLAAINTTLELLPAGSHIISINDLYGGTYRLFEQVKRVSSNLKFSYLSVEELEELDQHLTKETKMIWVESPTNPLLSIVDLEKVAELGKKYSLITVCDNTFATPYHQQPLKLGIDLVMHSTSKYIGGHSDLIGGAIICGTSELSERMAFLQNACGAIQGPFDSYLGLRGIKTLALRMERHAQSAASLAQFLCSHSKVEKVIYPGLPEHPQHQVAQKQMKNGFGGMISAELKGGIKESRKFLEACQIFTLAESLGGVESLIEHPAIMTHASIPAEVRKEIGISDGLIRISVGIEDIKDLQDDLTSALACL